MPGQVPNTPIASLESDGLQMRTYRMAVAAVIFAAIIVSLYFSTSNVYVTQVWNLLISTLHKPEFPINEKLFCEPDDNLLLLVAVFSGVDQGMERQFIRQNWGSYARKNNRIRLLFFIGLTVNEMDTHDIKRESQMYHDLIQFNSTDTYRNLTFKSFAYLRWSQQFCKSAKYLLKIDCDMQIDLKRLIGVLDRGNVIDSFQCGRIHVNQRPVRTLGHKWFIPKEIYPENVWPLYCYGPAYIISNRIASKIANLSIPKDAFPVDDVYITGILREKLKEKISNDILIVSSKHYIETDTKVINVKGKVTTYIKPVQVKDIQNKGVQKKPNS
ncbi:hypothetical protein FSP39_015816 [Pinctada imbricata]|uniref:Hexosyltransferase n=1 Tax=Pinctada imbricata TaxID=66713 RepID=A0AA89BME3_PINIB|nr:hypothetical protein FSP39_015816 [Pinctada imbricata]